MTSAAAPEGPQYDIVFVTYFLLRTRQDSELPFSFL